MKMFRQIREGMRVDYNVSIKARDGLDLMANIYYPMEEGVYPVIFNYGIYGKDLHYQDGYAERYRQLLDHAPEFFAGTTGLHHSWELLDPEKWCPHGYILARVDSRGTGQTAGYMHPYSMQEARDMYDCVEWFAAQPWCNGKVGISGTSYHAVSMWNVASLCPPHLAGFVAWEGHSDLYRDVCRHGGIFCNFFPLWFAEKPIRVQHGRGERGFISRANGLPVSGDVTLTKEELMKNRMEYGEVAAAKENTLVTDFHREAMPDLSKIKAPFIAIVNWVGQGLHLRGSVEAYVKAGSDEKYMYSLSGPHGELFFADFGVELQRKFFGHYLKGEDTGWREMPNVRLRIPHVGDKTFEDGKNKHVYYRAEKEFPLARTQYTKYYLDCENYGLSREIPSGSGEITYRGMGDGVTFLSQPLAEEMEFTGYIMSKLFVSSATEDADLFLVVRVFGPDMKEVVLWGANARNVPVAVGWQRASHRKLDPAKSTEYRPYLAHDELQPLKPGEVVEMNVEIWPTSITIPKGYRLGLTVRGKDYVYGGFKPAVNDIPKFDDNLSSTADGLGQVRHNDPLDRPAEIFDGDVTLHFDADRRPYLMLPIIPSKA